MSKASEAKAAKHPQKAFTIVEMMVTVGVFSVLLAILLPTVSTVHRAALNRQAQAGATMLAQSAMRYHAEYGFWPGELVSKDSSGLVKVNDELPETVRNGTDFCPLLISGPKDFVDKIESTTDDEKGGNNADIFKMYSNEVYRAMARVDLTQSGTRKTNPLNPKGIRFLDLERENEIDFVDYPDPWGNPYILFMGLRPHSTFTHTVKSSITGGTSYEVTISNVTAFAFSLGAKGSGSTNYIYSAGATR